jgi:hypothetical protein
VVTDCARASAAASNAKSTAASAAGA